MIYYLMKGDIKLVQINLKKKLFIVLRNDLLPFAIRDSFKKQNSKKTKPFNDSIFYYNMNIFLNYIDKRMSPHRRSYYTKLLEMYRLDTNDDLYSNSRNAFKCKAISMTDDYWIKNQNDTLMWKEVDPRNNTLNDTVSHFLLTGNGLIKHKKRLSHEFTTQGFSTKAWLRQNGKTYLIKKSFLKGEESDIEIRISNILESFNVDFLKYTPYKYKGSFYSKSHNLTSEKYSLVMAWEIYLYCYHNGLNFKDYILNIDKENIGKMCVIDYLFSNSNRSFLDWGFYMDNKTGKLVKCFPMIDYNNFFNENEIYDTDGGISNIFLGKTKKEAAIEGLNYCKINIPDKLNTNDFICKKYYKSYVRKINKIKQYL